MKRMGIYGGTFNPPHVGHLRAAEYAMEALELDRLLLIPNASAPHKIVAAGASPSQRLEMLELSAQGLENAQVSDREQARGGTSYTADTLAELKAEYPDWELMLLMGTDMFTSILTWYRPERILELATLAVFSRGQKQEKAAIQAQKEVLENLGAKVVVLENPVTAISSTDLRRMLVFRCADPFLCPGVGDYIRSNGLYDAARDYRNLPMEELEPVVLNLLNPNRVQHVLGCRDCAVELARHYGANVTDAARAGILHDITKAIDGPLQLTLCREYGMVLDKFSQENPKTLHALTGSLVAQRIFGENEAVVTAIRYHTTGRAGMSLLEKILYVADYIERNRDFPGVDDLRAAAWRSIDEAMLLGMEMTMAHVKRQGQELAGATVDAVEYLKRELGMA